MNRTGDERASYGLPEQKKDAGPNLPQMAQFIREMTKNNITPAQVAKFLTAFGLKQVDG